MTDQTWPDYVRAADAATVQAAEHLEATRRTCREATHEAMVAEVAWREARDRFADACEQFATEMKKN